MCRLHYSNKYHSHNPRRHHLLILDGISTRSTVHQFRIRKLVAPCLCGSSPISYPQIRRTASSVKSMGIAQDWYISMEWVELISLKRRNKNGKNRPNYLLLSLIIVISVLDSKIFFIEEKIEKLLYENSMNETNHNESILLIQRLDS